MSESNKDEALRCLAIAQQHRDNGNTDAAIKFGKKSLSLYHTAKAVAFLEAIEHSSSSSMPTPTPDPPPPTSTSGFSPSLSSTSQRTPSESSTSQRGDPERVAVVRRIRACKPTQYYEILDVKRGCSEGDIKKAYRKLALLTHPDKCSNISGAAEAFKMVAKAWQVLGDAGLRAQYDAAPEADPLSRFSQGGNPASQAFAGGAMSPEELFDMFFNGGFGARAGFGGPVFTASFGPGGFQTHPRRRQANEGNQENAAPTTPFFQLLPLIILFSISLLSSLPGIASLFATPDPGYTFSPAPPYSSERLTSNYRISYFVDPKEFQAHSIFQSIPDLSRDNPQAGATSSKLRIFEASIERGYVSSMRTACNREFESKEQRMDQHRGIFGFLGDPEMVEKIRQEPMPSCQRLRDMGLLGP
ncbi:DnaJ-domain-containing protein [Clavulina sp. PMI_390]|nr:DnaJ-domain-containing protein [Clavulina sp. PMI_390]